MTAPVTKDGVPTLHVHLLERPNTVALTSGRLTSPEVELEFGGPKVPPAGFRQMVREGTYDISEMPLATFLVAKDCGKPLSLLPAVVMARFQHRMLVCRKDSKLRPQDLPGRTILGRSYTVTTVTLVREILQMQYGVPAESMNWLCTEDSHVEEYRPPAFVKRIELGDRTLEDLVLDGTADAAILWDETDHPGLRTLIDDPDKAARDWYASTGTLQINHIVTVRSAIARRHPHAVQTFWELLDAARRDGMQEQFGVDMLPFGLEANRRNLEMALDAAFSQGLTGRRLQLDELFDDTLRAFI